MRRGADTSVLVPALLAYHEAHETCEAALAEVDCAIAHVIAETYSVLTRLPHPIGVSPAAAAAALDGRTPQAVLSLSADAHRALATRLAHADIRGGAVYDGLIALTAAEHGIEIVSRDRRSIRTYETLGVRHVLLAS